MRNTRKTIILLLLLIVPYAYSGDLSTDVRSGANSPNAADGGYIELGASIDLVTSPFYGIPEGEKPNETFFAASIDINSRWQYKGWFVEVFSQSLEQLTLGYNFFNSTQWAVDLVALEEHSEISDEVSDDLKGIRTRYGDYMMGPRATGYFDDYIFQAHLLTDVSDTHNGQVLSAKVARHWQVKNWNFHAIAGASYRSTRVANYYLSVDAADATEKFPEFHAQAGFTQVYEVGATYPINEKWVFRTLFRHVELDRQWRGSPLLTSTHGDIYINSIAYVF